MPSSVVAPPAASSRKPTPGVVRSARERLAINMLRLRQRKGWSQEELAFEAGLHRTFIAHVERQARNISLDNVEKIAVALGVSVSGILQE